MSAWALLGRLIYRTAGVIALPVLLNGSSRVRVAIVDPEKCTILLSKSWISSQKWELIGGGVKNSEGKLDAVKREASEEAGVTLDTSKLKFIDRSTVKDYFATCTADTYFVAMPEKPLVKAKLELLDLAWFSLDDLPESISSHAMKIIKSKLHKQG